jgi:hypothetical protein
MRGALFKIDVVRGKRLRMGDDRYKGSEVEDLEQSEDVTKRRL